MIDKLEYAETTEAQTARYRSGVAARLAGLPVETLRVWERRYGISETARSAHGQRLYSDAQVKRLRLMKQLVDQGHPIGALAQLPIEELLASAVVAPARSPSQPIRVVLVGRALAQQLAGGARELFALDIVAKSVHLDGAAAELSGKRADVVLIEMSELAESALPAIAALRQQLGAAAVVLYRFCASATIRHLRAQGCLAARAPTDAAEIVLLCQTAAAAQPVAVDKPRADAPAPRRFDDQALTALAATKNRIDCECPRHLSEILLMLNSFERYSEQCASRTPADALLHQELSHAAGSARMVMESALERLARAEGLPLPPGL
jgi:DNA-binding transcriptional MerR regulator